MRVISYPLQMMRVRQMRIKNWSHKSSRHLQKTHARQMGVDMRCLPGAYDAAYFGLYSADQLSEILFRESGIKVSSCTFSFLGARPVHYFSDQYTQFDLGCRCRV